MAVVVLLRVHKAHERDIMNKRIFTLLTVISTSSLFGISCAFAGDFEFKNMKKGDTFCYKIVGGSGDGNSWCLAFKGPRVMEYRSDNGNGLWRWDIEGQLMSRGRRKFTTIKGGAKWPYKVGLKWKKTWKSYVYEFEPSQYTSKCKVKKREVLKTAAGTFDTHRVDCTEQHIDYLYPYHSREWFDIKTNMIVQAQVGYAAHGGYKLFLTSAK